MKKITTQTTSPDWHKVWFDHYLSKYCDYKKIQVVDLNLKPVYTDFILFLRSFGYDAWWYIPLTEEEYAYVRVSDDDYVMEQLRSMQ